MNSHPDMQEAPSRERNLWINGNNNFPLQAVQNLKVTMNKMLKLLMIKKMHLLKDKTIPWVKR
jgi:hypothetical protein